MEATKDITVYFEQPCHNYEACRTVRQSCPRPLILDESAVDLTTIIKGWHEGGFDGINLKIGKVGGLTKALKIRNLCAGLGIPMYIQCAGGNSLTQAAIVHLAQSTPPNRLFSVWDIGDIIRFQTASNAIKCVGGLMRANELPGLGMEMLSDTLGEPVQVYE